mmetsp:Transcript_7011/g.26195  ORF Transcript_7011/g.26195 Transcript_7011/m.26195 type:complete len:203 (+) Transcript_7011:277-885(+)
MIWLQDRVLVLMQRPMRAPNLMHLVTVSAQRYLKHSSSFHLCGLLAAHWTQRVAQSLTNSFVTSWRATIVPRRKRESTKSPRTISAQNCQKSTLCTIMCLMWTRSAGPIGSIQWSTSQSPTILSSRRLSCQLLTPRVTRSCWTFWSKIKTKFFLSVQLERERVPTSRAICSIRLIACTIQHSSTFLRAPVQIRLRISLSPSL